MKKKETIEDIQKELKTLKNYEDEFVTFKASVLPKLLKDEAKKWIKYFNMLGDYFKESDEERSNRHYAQTIALEMFFDLGEECDE